MKYKTLAVAVGSVILFAGCNDSLIFKRLNKTEEWLKAADAKLKDTKAELESTKTDLEATEAELAELHESTEAKLASMRSKNDQAQADLRKAERSIDSLTAKNVALAAYKNKRESADAEARRKYEEANRVEKLIGTWREATDKNPRVVEIMAPRDLYGPVTASDLRIREYKGPYSDDWDQAVEVAFVALDHVQFVVAAKTRVAGWKHAVPKIYGPYTYHVKLIAPDTIHFWESSSFLKPDVLKRVGS